MKVRTLFTFLLLPVWIGVANSFQQLPNGPSSRNKHQRRELREVVIRRQERSILQHEHEVLVDQTRQQPPIEPVVSQVHSQQQLLHENEHVVTKHNIQQEKNAKATLANFLVLIGGVANVVCYKKFGFYASMMTGNIIRFCMAVVDFRL